MFAVALEAYAGKWEVGTLVSFTVVVNDKGTDRPIWLVLAAACDMCTFGREATGEGCAAD